MGRARCDRFDKKMSHKTDIKEEKRDAREYKHNSELRRSNSSAFIAKFNQTFENGEKEFP
jgi:hypothetical protein